MTDKETQQADIRKRLKELHKKLRRLNLPISSSHPDKDNQTTGTTAGQTTVNHVVHTNSGQNG